MLIRDCEISKNVELLVQNYAIHFQQVAYMSGKKLIDMYYYLKTSLRRNDDFLEKCVYKEK